MKRSPKARIVDLECGGCSKSEMGENQGIPQKESGVVYMKKPG